ncbi:MAG: DUF5074 domain-containing protein [Muribaculaceae bacterium]|nr:DUF5074 domain-containing protein [Muribaculaceae bacterium]
MKTATTAATLALAALLPGMAYGADALSDIRWTPDPDEAQQSLTKITLQFMDANWGISGHVDVSGITLTRRGSTETLYALPDPVTDYARLILEFGYKGDTTPATVTTEGIYTLHIPAGAVTAMSTGTPNAEINQDFTVSTTVATPMSAYTLTPAPGEVEEIGTVTISFPESGGLDWFANDLYGAGSFSAITLTDKGNPEICYTAVKQSFDMNATVGLAFVAPGTTDKVTISAPGTYILDIPADMFVKDYTSIGNSHITCEYVILPSTPQEFSGMEATPADGKTIGQLTDITLRFPSLPGGLDYPVSDIGRVTVLTPEGDTYCGFNARVGGTGYDTLTLSFAPEGATAVNQARTFTTAGTYTVSFPEGVLKGYGTDAVNPAFTLSYTVDPLINFTCSFDPADRTVASGFIPVTLHPGHSISSIQVNDDAEGLPCFSDGTTDYVATAIMNDADGSVTFIPHDADAVATPGEWTLTVPARYLYGLNGEGERIFNPEPISYSLMVREAESFGYSVTPADGETVEFFKNVTLGFSGENLKGINLDPAAGTPLLTAASGEEYPLEARLSGNYVIFVNRDGRSIPDGEYDFTLPAGYIVTIDRDGLTATVPAACTALRIESTAEADYARGVLILNEGWFGHDTGSLNFLSPSGDWIYDAYLRNNPDHRLGITSQYGQCFADQIYIVSKQPEGDASGDGGVLTVLDASTLRYAGEIHQLPDDLTEPRAFCAWDRHKGYLSTRDHIYAIDLDRLEILSVVEGTDQYTSFDSNGEMLRYGDRVLAVRQSTGVDAIDPLTDDVVKIPAELTEALAVTPDGSLYAATRNEANEFIKISPATLTIERLIDIEGDKVKIANVWDTWKKAPIAADKTRNAVYYVTQKAMEEEPQGPRTVARYDFDTDEFTETFITLPGTAEGYDADWVLYGEGVSVDPASGNIMLAAVEAGYGVHFSRNCIFEADPATGEIVRTIPMEKGYWFPAMTLYPDFAAPSIDALRLTLPADEAWFTLDVASATTLPTGNPHLIRYTARTLTGTAEVTPAEAAGTFEVSATEGGEYELELTADYQGKSTTVILSGISTGIPLTPAGATGHDVYNLQGIRIMTGATSADLQTLPAGIYIVGGRKFAVR